MKALAQVQAQAMGFHQVAQPIPLPILTSARLNAAVA